MPKRIPKDIAAHRYRFGLGFRLVIMIMAPVVAVSALLILFFLHHFQQVMRADLEQRGNAMAENFASQVEYPLLVGNRKELDRLAGAVLQDADTVLVMIRDEKGVCASSSSESAFAQLLEARKGIVDARPYEVRLELKQLGRYYEVSVPVRSVPVAAASDEDSMFGDAIASTEKKTVVGHVIVGLWSERRELLLTRLYGTSLILALCVVVAAMIFAFLLARLVVEPVRKLVDATQRIAAGNLDIAVPAKGTDEIGELAVDFNVMSARLKDTMRGLKAEIFERKQAEQELLGTKSYLNSVINSLPSTLIGVDAHGKILNINLAAARAADTTIEDAIGKDIAVLFPQVVDYLGGTAMFADMRDPIERQRVPYEHAGEKKLVNVSAYPLAENIIRGMVIRVEDVTDKVRMEEMMVQTEKMMSVGGLAAGMAHEINNPLGAILQGVQNLRRRISPDLAKNVEAAKECGIELSALHAYLEKREITKFLDGIVSSGERAAKIVANMLQFSRQSESIKSDIGVHELIEKTIELSANDYNLKKQYDFREIELVRAFDPAVKSVKCVVTEIEQVLLNLLKNAAQAMAMHKKDGVRPRIEIRTKVENGMAVIEIEDNGPGMDEKTKKRIFEPFFTTKPVGIGTGLGLSVSYFIITEKHNGLITVESTKDVGTTFIIQLPLD
jgi:PAS domain S-box-containing protein